MQPGDAHTDRQRNWLLVALVAVTAIATAGVVWAVIQSARSEVRHATRASISAAVDQTQAHLEGFFHPIEELLVMTAQWGANGELDLNDDAALAAHFIPVLGHTPVSSLMVADERGGEFMLLQTGDGFRSRVTRPEQWGQRARWTRWRADGTAIETTEEDLDYDARRRPWYQAARAAGDDALAFTPPYTFFTTKEPGITGSRQFSTGGGSYVVGFDILLNDISRLTGAIDLSPHGRVVVLSADGRIVGLPRDPRFEGDGMVRAVLKRPAEVDLPEVVAAVAAAGDRDREHFAFDAGGERWWAGRRTVDVSGQKLAVVVAVPERDVVGNAASHRNQVILVLLAGVVIAGVLLFMFHRHVRRELDRATAKLQRVGQYTLERQIGAGGMGTVYRARHALLRRPTAIKLLDSERARDPRAVARFTREVELTSHLTHPNTIAVYDFGFTTKGVFFYAMEYLRGADLQAIVRRTGPLAPARTVHVLTQVCGSLTEAHAAGLTHRDIKPGNVILCERGGVYDFAKVLDFGLVKRAEPDGDPAESARLTQDGSISGTPYYMSPEAINSPRHVGPASDIYAVGAMGYFLLTGEPPFDGNTFMELCVKHATAPPPPLPDDVPGDVADLLQACLAKSPADRPTAANLGAAFAGCSLAGAWTQGQATSWWVDHMDLLADELQDDEADLQTIQVPIDSATT